MPDRARKPEPAQTEPAAPRRLFADAHGSVSGPLLTDEFVAAEAEIAEIPEHRQRDVFRVEKLLGELLNLRRRRRSQCSRASRPG